MEGNWYLYSDAIKSKCESFKTILNTDIENHENALTQLQKIVEENRLRGQALETFRNQLTDYYAAMELCKSADEKDIEDCNTLIGSADETFDGDFISLMYNNAENNRNTYKVKAIAEWALAAAFVTTAYSFNPVLGIWVQYTIANPHISTAEHYDQMADSYQADMDRWQAKKDKFDKINSDTSSLFTSGQNIRTSANSLLAEMDKHSIAGTYNTNITASFLGQMDSLSDGFKVLNKIVHDKDYYKLSMENFKKDHPEYTEMIDLQADIYYLEEQIENCPNGTAQAEMIKQLAILRNRMDSLFMQNACNYDASGNIIGNKLEDFYYEKDINGNYVKSIEGLKVISFFVDIYEANHPSAKPNMDHMLHDPDPTLTSQLDSKYYEDFINIKFITYTAPEPERSVVIEYAAIINVDTFDENATQHWAPYQVDSLGNPDPKLHLDLDGYSGRDKGMKDEFGPYRSVFHEIGHAIDDLSVPEQSPYKMMFNKANLSYQPDANGNSLQDYTRRDVEFSFKCSISTACYETRNYTMSLEDRQEILDYIMSPNNGSITLNSTQQAVYDHLLAYYDHKDPSTGTFIQGTHYSRYDYPTVKNAYTGKTYPATEVYLDVCQGYLDNKLGPMGFNHTTANYWYDTSGNETYYQSLEFFAETLSQRMTYSQYHQFDATKDFFPNGVSRYEAMIVELSLN